MEATCQYRFLYRLLRPDENPQVNGIKAECPGANVSVHEHVSTGSNRKSQYISSCASPEAVETFAERSSTFPKRVAKINVDELEDIGEARFIDLTEWDNRLDLLEDDKAMNFARKFEEILIVGEIPTSCIVQIYRIQ